MAKKKKPLLPPLLLLLPLLKLLLLPLLTPPPLLLLLTLLLPSNWSCGMPVSCRSAAHKKNPPLAGFFMGLEPRSTHLGGQQLEDLFGVVRGLRLSSLIEDVHLCAASGLRLQLDLIARQTGGLWFAAEQA